MKKKLIKVNLLFLLSILLFTQTSVDAQQITLNLPEVSQKAMIMQRIGLTDITIAYSSPQVKGRKVWGEMVQYNQVWRAGANANTTISFTHDVKIEGSPIAAGTYGLHMIPSEKEWIVIFSKNYTSWGSYFYKKEEDALRVNVKPVAGEFSEWLNYNFIDRSSSSVVAVLHWEKLKIPFKIDVDVPAVVLNNIRNELRGTAGIYSWQGYYQAANYCIQNNINHEEAEKWIEMSIRQEENFSNLRIKALFLEKKGNIRERDEIMKKAIAIANENILNNYGYQLLAENKINEAINIFKFNVQKFPEGFNVYDSLGEAYGISGDKKSAITNYKLALKKAPEDHKQRIESILKNLENSSL